MKFQYNEQVKYKRNGNLLDAHVVEFLRPGTGKNGLDEYMILFTDVNGDQLTTEVKENALEKM